MHEKCFLDICHECQGDSSWFNTLCFSFLYYDNKKDDDSWLDDYAKAAEVLEKSSLVEKIEGSQYCWKIKKKTDKSVRIS